jgi:hypothetical protein
MTTFKGRQTGFNPKGSNDCTPNMSGPPATKFGGRPAVPAGPLKLYPGGVAEIDNGNRRLAKSDHGTGVGSMTNFCSTGGNAFANGGQSPGIKPKTYDTKGGSGVRKGRKT